MNGQKPEAQAGHRVETFSLKNTQQLANQLKVSFHATRILRSDL